MKKILFIAVLICGIFANGQEYSGGIEIGTGFKLSDPQPIDDRYVVADSASLSNLPNIYEGLTSYSVADSALFVYDGEQWSKVAKETDLNYIPLSGTEEDKPITGIFEFEEIDSGYLPYPEVNSNMTIKDENDISLLEIGTGWNGGNEMAKGGQIALHTAPDGEGEWGDMLITPYQIHMGGFGSESVYKSAYRVEGISFYDATGILDLGLSGISKSDEGDNIKQEFDIDGKAIKITSTISDFKGIVGDEEYDKQGDRKAYIQLSDLQDGYIPYSGTDKENEKFITGDLDFEGEKTHSISNINPSTYEGSAVFFDTDGFSQFVAKNDNVSQTYLYEDGFRVSFYKTSSKGIIGDRLYDKAGDTKAFAQIGDLGNYIPISQKGVANGVASLDGGGKIPATQLPNSVMTLEGEWNASTNTPTLADGVGDPGMIYEVTTGGTVDLGSGDITFAVGDYVVYGSSGVWYKSVNSNEVVSVNGMTGIVELGISDLTDVENYTAPNLFAVSNSDGDGVEFRKLKGTDFGSFSGPANRIPVWAPNLDEFIMYVLSSTSAAETIALRTTVDGRIKMGNPTETDDGVTLGYANSNFQPLDADLTSIAGLSGTSGLLVKTAANTWSLDTTHYATISNLEALEDDIIELIEESGKRIVLNITETISITAKSAVDKALFSICPDVPTDWIDWEISWQTPNGLQKLSTATFFKNLTLDTSTGCFKILATEANDSVSFSSLNSPKLILYY